MDGKRADTSEWSASDTTLLGDKNALPSTKGNSFVEGKAFWSPRRDVSGTGQSGACPTLAKIQEWTDRANISFKYTKKKIEQSLKKAKEKMRKREAKKMPEESGCNHLECTQCKVSFLSEAELREHYDSDEHLAKVRAKSESKTLGDLNLFRKTCAHMRKFILDKIPLPPPKQPSPPLSPTAATKKVSEQTQESLLPDQQSLPPPDTTELTTVGNSFDSYNFSAENILAGYLDPDHDPDLDLKMDGIDEERDQPTDAAQLQKEASNEEEHRNGIDEEKIRANLQKEIRELKEENMRLKQVETETEEAFCQRMQITLQKMLLELKKNEKKDEMGYEFPNDKFYRVMDVSTQDYKSVWELVMYLSFCFVTVNRGTGYKERSSEGGRSEEGEEEASKKRKRGRGEAG
mmetsp:Transcript_24542/g.38537  ORF Transcript_24542/g.38537 Transcript_24542/m.38537 type:complete len:404 (+) Transcript_24542:229-1440(+)